MRRASWPRLLALTVVLSVSAVGLTECSKADQSALAAQASPAASPLGGTLTAGGSRLITTKVTGAKSHLTDTVITILPSGYDKPENANTKYPFIVMFSGMPGSASSWVKYLNISTHLEDVEGDTLTPVIAVLVPVYFNYDTECIDFKGYPQTGTWIGTDIPAWIHANWRVSDNREDHLLAGFSAGGWCAAMLATMEPDEYRAVITFAGYFAPTFDQAQLLDHDSRGSKFVLANALSKTTKPLAFYIAASRNDPISYPSGLNFAKAVKNKLVKVTYVENPAGGHYFSVWEDQLVAALDWLPNAVPGLAYQPPNVSDSPAVPSAK